MRICEFPAGADKRKTKPRHGKSESRCCNDNASSSHSFKLKQSQEDENCRREMAKEHK